MPSSLVLDDESENPTFSGVDPDGLARCVCWMPSVARMAKVPVKRAFKPLVPSTDVNHATDIHMINEVAACGPIPNLPPPRAAWTVGLVIKISIGS